VKAKMSLCLSTTKTMELSPSWEPNSHSPCLRLLWNLKIHYRVHKSQSLTPVLIQMKPVNTFPPCFLKIYTDINHPYTQRSSEWSLHFRFSDRNCLHFLWDPCLLHAPSTSSLLIWSPEQYMVMRSSYDAVFSSLFLHLFESKIYPSTPCY